MAQAEAAEQASPLRAQGPAVRTPRHRRGTEAQPKLWQWSPCTKDTAQHREGPESKAAGLQSTCWQTWAWKGRRPTEATLLHHVCSLHDAWGCRGAVCHGQSTHVCTVHLRLVLTTWLHSSHPGSPAPAGTCSCPHHRCTASGSCHQRARTGYHPKDTFQPL